MTEYCFQSTKTSTNFNLNNNNNNKNKFSDFTIVLCSFILSHPLYFSYLIFFSPYLFKLLSFLSPLFFTTFLLFLSLPTTLTPLHSIINTKEGFLLSVYNTLLENLHSNLEDEDVKSQPIEEFEVYKVVFEIPTIEVAEKNPVENRSFEENPVENEGFEDDPDEFSVKKVSKEGKKIGDKCESLTMEQEKVDTKPKKVKEEVKKLESIIKIKKRESKDIEVYETPKKGGSLRFDHGEKFSEAFSPTVGGQPYMGSFGSMRKEKEWRRTLACKIFEERHNGSNNNLNVNGGGSEEGMDLLWETYETELNRVKTEEDSKKGRRREKMEELMKVNEDEDDYIDNSKFCCLQALKLSAGKVNMGMKISKAFKGFGLLHSHVRKQGRKGYK